jgi:DNA-binding transcriptional MerR regulator
MTERITIGDLARRTGLPVKTLRFWSDEGLLPPSSRSASGYRLYGEEALLRLELVRSLREAGLGLETIKKVLRRDMSLSDALRLQLAAVEAHAASLSRVAAALRAALRGEPDESDVRRLCAVTRLTNDERRTVIEGFYARVSEGIPIDDAWQRKMIEASAPKLPDNPTPEQLDAWIELAELVADPTFVENLRASAKEVWDRRLDIAALRAANEEAARAAASARAASATPASEEGRTVVEKLLEGLARASNKPVDDELRRSVRERFERHDPRASRYWELVAVMSGRPPAVGNVEDWRFIAEAVKVHLTATKSA